MRIWLIPTNPAHIEACMLMGVHGTNAPNFKPESGDLVVTYLTERHEIVAVSTMVGPTFSSSALDTLWSESYRTLFRLQTLQALPTPLHVEWKRAPGRGTYSPRYDFNPPVGPQELSPRQLSTILEDIQSQER